MTDVVPRDKNGRLLRGAALNPAGRRSYPKWYTDAGEDSLAMQVAAATGRVVDGLDMDPAVLAAVTAMALDAPPTLRVEAARRMNEAIYGKARDMIANGPQVIKSITFVVVESPQTLPQEIEVSGTVVKRS